MGRLLAVAALQRSGTTALGRALGTVQNVRSLGEVFHSSRNRELASDFDALRLTDNTNFHLFKQARVIENPEFAFPLAPNQSLLFRHFLDHIGEPDRSWTAIDVKYNSWHHLDGIWRMPDEPPQMIEHFKGFGAAIIHLKRRDLLARHVSGVVANKRGIFHYQPGEQVAAVQTHLDIECVEADLVRSRHLVAIFDRWLADYPDRVEFWYEDLFAESGALSDRVRTTLKDRLGLDIGDMPVMPDLVRATPDPSAVITNWDSIQRAIDPALRYLG